ncbi:MAG: right-handed parallel beta-helix repeat-containing protein [Deltaproteobacteria bacterium]|nr:right-handed parallel beta-helix repeat-containing protein [Deltaproteobacteria bacterium]
MALNTRVPIGRQDLALYDGLNSTFRRPSNTGGIDTLLTIGGEVDILTVYGGGVDRSSRTIQEAINAVGSSTVAFSFAPGTWSIGADISFPKNIYLKPSVSALFHISVGKTLLVYSPAHLIAESNQQVHGNVLTGGTLSFLKGGTVHPDWFMENTTPGTTDMTVASQSAVDSLSKGTVRFLPETYVFSADVTGASNVNLTGNGATLTFTTTWAIRGTFFLLDDVDDITIKDFTFDGQGEWTDTPFANPYGAGNKVGFTNDQIGISNIGGASDNIVIKNNTFKGLGRAGIRLTGGGETLKILNNDFENLGQAGIFFYEYNDFTVTGNTISGVYGQMAATEAESSSGDGIYIYDSQKGTISINTITDLIRIGIVLEGVSDAVYNTAVTISGNTISNLHTSRNGEYNAAIWCEREEMDYTVIITGNTLDNVGAAAAANGKASRGIEANRATIVANVIRGFGIGISGRGFTATGNTIFLNIVGIRISQDGEADDKCTELLGNNIHSNTDSGIVIAEGDYSDGHIIIQGGIIRDNGTSSSEDYYKSGILINGFWVAQRVWITGVTFISTADESDTDGQLYGIMLRDDTDDDTTWTSKYIMENTFSFTGTFTTAYPANLGSAITPTSMGYDNLSAIASYELMPGDPQNNQNSKAMGNYATAQGVNFHTGKPFPFGFGSAAPGAGTHRQGDYIYNNDVDAGEYMGWICVTAGTPGTWKGFGIIEA